MTDNALAAAVFAQSCFARAPGAKAAGKMLNLVGLLVLSAGGALGGHLSYAQGTGVHRRQSAKVVHDDRPPGRLPA
jgi:hypothetical protein